MQIIPQSVHLLDSIDLHTRKFAAQTKYFSQHGNSHNIVDNRARARGVAHLLAIPSESLTHITSFLDPASLFALGKSCKILHEHIDDDNTWHRAFAWQFLGEPPDKFDSQQNFLLHRTEDTWRKEFVSRCKLIRRWERCRNGTISHTPHHSPVASMHLLSDQSYGPALLSVSLQYGVVARSFPLSGKVIKGFLTSSDGFGLGIGNPNAEFAPDVSSCAVTSEGWTARIVFGFTNGEVVLVNALRVMESARRASKVIRCRVDEQHRGPVNDIAWAGSAFVTAGVDGEVRFWDAQRMRCAFVLKDRESLVPDPCVHVVANLERGIVLSTKKSGTTVIWTDISLVNEMTQAVVMSPKFRISAPSTEDNELEPSTTFVDRSFMQDAFSFIIHFLGQIHFFRVNINLISGQYEFIKFSGGLLGPIQTIVPFFPSTMEDSKTVILVGDGLGRVSLFDWSSSQGAEQEGVSSFARFDAFSDGYGVSAICCDPHVIAVGSIRGTTKIFDILTLRLLREFPSPLPRPSAGMYGVNEIILQRGLLLVAVGERILAWEAKPVRPHQHLRSLKKGSTKGRNAKWHKRLELAQDISESQKAVEDAHASERRSHERRRAQQAALSTLGLEEHEALEYVLMLSREEAAQQGHLNDAMFGAEFGDVPLVRSESQSSTDSEESSASDSSLSNVQAASSSQAELLEADRVGTSPRPINSVAQAIFPPSFDDADHFPAMGSSVSSTTSIPRSSPSSAHHSWSARIRASTSTSTSSAFGPSVSSFSNPSVGRRVLEAASPGPSLLSESLRLHSQQESADEEVDADVKLALELSLAESLSLEQT